MANENIIELTADNFQSELEGEGPLLVDFWAEWCAPCRAVAPVLDELANEYEGKVRIGKLNIDSNQELSMQFGVRSIPTFMLFKGGEIADTMMGAMPKAAFERFIDKNVEAEPAGEEATEEPVDSASGDEAPAESASADEEPTEEASLESASADEESAESAAADEAPAEVASAEAASAEAASAASARAEASPADAAAG